MTKRQNRVLTSLRAIEETLKNPPPGSVLYLSGDSRRIQLLASLASRAGIPIKRESRESLRATGGERARDCVLQVPAEENRSRSLSEPLNSLTAGHAIVLLLDHVTDPHNYGAILRSADQFGVDAVVVPSRGAARLTSTVIESSAGTARHVTTITVANLSAAIRELKQHEFWVYAAMMDGQSIGKTSLNGRVALVLGSEGSGVSRLVADKADLSVAIPTRGHADSLNVSVACGVILYEVRRQQGWL
jgi:23S rRNA (guanosine2251-2'-O)-methyltransferase